MSTDVLRFCHQCGERIADGFNHSWHFRYGCKLVRASVAACSDAARRLLEKAEHEPWLSPTEEPDPEHNPYHAHDEAITYAVNTCARRERALRALLDATGGLSVEGNPADVQRLAEARHLAREALGTVPA